MDLTVEDIMCDQRIMFPDFNATNITIQDDGNYLAVPTSRKVWLQNVLYTFRYHLVPALSAFLANSISKSLAPLQRIPLHLHSGVIKIRLRRKRKSQLAITDTIDASNIEDCLADEKTDEAPEKCVDCTVLHEPNEEPCADVIFIHGLHGGLDRTWTQGTWRMNNPKLKDLTGIRRRSTSEDLYVSIREDPQVKEGRLKRTLTGRYTTIPIKMPRKNDNNVDAIPDEHNSEHTIQVEQIEYVEDAEDVENFSRCWPKDWLPQDCPGVRVLAINYTTDVLWRPLWQKMKIRTDLIQRSKEMMEELLRLGVGTRPIVWVGHSKGGLYIKQIILNGSNADGEDKLTRNLYDQTKAIMFYSVPHKGSPIADMTFPFFRRSIEVMEVRTNCEFVLDLHSKFLELINKENIKKPEIFSFIDTENTPVAFTSFKFIAYESADPDIGIRCVVPLDHREICKPAGRDCFLYLELVKLINRSILNTET